MRPCRSQLTLRLCVLNHRLKVILAVSASTLEGLSLVAETVRFQPFSFLDALPAVLGATGGLRHHGGLRTGHGLPCRHQ